MQRRLNQHRNLVFMTEPDPTGAGIAPASTDPRAAENAGKTFTQDQVTAFLAREKDQGERAGKAAIAQALNAKLEAAGFTPEDLDTVISTAAQAKTAADQLKTQAEKDRDEAIARADAAERAAQQAREDLRATQVRSALVTAGAANVDIAYRALDVPADADPAVVKAAVDKLKADAPGLFTAGTVQHSDTGTPPGGAPAGKSARERAAEIAKARGYTAA